MLGYMSKVATSDRPAAQNTRALKAVFRTLTSESCPKAYNFHMHSVCSDGRLQPENIMEQAIALGLKGLAITDHHSADGYRRAQRWLDEWHQSVPDAPAPYLWTGVEINADLIGTEVHILGYGYNPDRAEMQPYLQGEKVKGEAFRAEQVIAAIQAAGGLAVLAHPARYRRSICDLIPAAAARGIDGAEAYYAYNNPDPWHPSPEQTVWVKRLNAQYGLFDTCGTDTHGLSLLRRM
ncbi:MAG: PHP domain-containing protein [Cyanobacteria bacterium SID2]|nr:PHP domain-containing protein [Cyanobacteria bacterium SID2]MBP0003770.1 PHP domain-containing protein [Cyanobacteria bacterium SBC]